MPDSSCAYCGSSENLTREHVIPKCLYPPSKNGSSFQRIIVSGCRACNNGWAKDEEHFKAVITVAGDASPVVHELWQSISRSFQKAKYGATRMQNLAKLLVPVETSTGPRYKIFPGKDPRVIRVIKKMVRGLCHHHGLITCVKDEQIFADVQTIPIPKELEQIFNKHHAEPEVLEYRFGVVQGWPFFHSMWQLSFFKRTNFIVVVYTSPQAVIEASQEDAFDRFHFPDSRDAH